MAFGDGTTNYIASGIKVILTLGVIAIITVGTFIGIAYGANLGWWKWTGWLAGLVGGFLGSSLLAMLIFGPFAIMIRMVDLLTQISSQIDTATRTSGSSDLE